MVDLVAQIWTFAAAYGAGPYGEGTYNNGAVADVGGGGELVKTGFVIAGLVTVGCLLVFLALLARFAKRKKQANYKRVR